MSQPHALGTDIKIFIVNVEKDPLARRTIPNSGARCKIL